MEIRRKKGFHLVKWCKVMHGKKQGRLGIRNLKWQSYAIKLKWLWRYSQDSEAYQLDIIRAKYIPDNKGSKFTLWCEFMEFHKNKLASNEGSHHYQGI